MFRNGIQIRPKLEAPSADVLARRFGLDNWQNGSSNPSFCVHYQWLATGSPSFHDAFVLGAIEADNWIEEPGDGTTWRMAAFACGEAAEVINLRVDAVARRLREIAIICPVRRLWRDGIHYTLLTSGAAEGKLAFGNPEHPSLIALEKTLLRLGHRIAESSGNSVLKECVETWRRYCRGRTKNNSRGSSR